MILFDLECPSGHVFEGWFPSGEAYDEQSSRGQINCPVCGSSEITKAPMAPRTERSSARKAERKAAQGTVLRAMRELRKVVEDNSENVGRRFAEEARSIHFGESEKRNIIGETTPDEERELRRDGVPVSRIPWVPRADN